MNISKLFFTLSLIGTVYCVESQKQVVPSETTQNAAQQAADDDNFLKNFDVISSDEPIMDRPLPWYLNIIQKPAAFVLINACAFWDWLHNNYVDKHKRLVAWWCTKKIRDKRTQTQLSV